MRHCYIKRVHMETVIIFQLVGEKVGFALESGLKVIPCVGEKLEEREAGNTNNVVFRQCKAIGGNLSSRLNICVLFF